MSAPPPRSGRSNAAEVARDVLAFWERGRVLYNGALLVWVAGLLAVRFEPPPSLVDYLGFLGLWAIAVNLAYCVAYPIDLAMQQTPWRARWRHGRWGMLALGTLGAGSSAFRFISAA